MKTLFGIFIIQTFIYLVLSNDSFFSQDSDKFLTYFEHQTNDAEPNSSFYLEESQEYGSEIKPIRCFWLETKSMNVFDLKDLKKPFNQK